MPSTRRNNLKKKVSSAFAAGTEKCLHSKDAFALRMRRVEDERREERRILSCGQSGVGREGGREERMV